MITKRLSFLFLAVLLTCGEAATQVKRSRAFSLIELIVRRPSSERTLVRTAGFLSLNFEDTALYMDAEAHHAHLFKNSVWLELSPEQLKSCLPLDGKYVTIEAWFTKRQIDSQELSSGTLTQARSMTAVVGQKGTLPGDCLVR